MSRLENTDCPVGIRILSEAEFNRPRRGQHFEDAQYITQTVNEATHSAQDYSQSSKPEHEKTA